MSDRREYASPIGIDSSPQPWNIFIYFHGGGAGVGTGAVAGLAWRSDTKVRAHDSLTRTRE